jgi:hypothetical protein
VVPVIVGWLISLVGGLWFLVVAFQEGPHHGILCLCLPFYSLYFLITHFDETKRPFFLNLIGFAITMAGSCAGGLHGERGGGPPDFRGQLVAPAGPPLSSRT